MRFTHFTSAFAAATLSSISSAQSFISSNPISAASIASSLTASYPNPSIALLPQPYWWWQSGSSIDALLNYFHTTGDTKYNALLSNTMLSQTTGTNDFMTPDATGNDDQAWWGLAAMSAAEYGLPPAQGALPWIEYARNVFNTQKGRWRTDRCNGGLKWKINENDPAGGWNYRSTISNGLFFQLAARIARFTTDADALSWAEKSYDWITSVGLVDGQFNVFDGTDDAKGTGCIDVNHSQWSYNAGVMLYGAAVMAEKTGAQVWKDRAQGFLTAARRNFIKDGKLFESICDGDGSCNTDQVSFKGVLARWMGNTATLLPDKRAEVTEVMGGVSDAVTKDWSAGQGVMQHFTALEVIDALVNAGGGIAAPGKAEAVKARRARRSIAGRIWGDL
jgi:mannan endo-1,6-alpha-mannosidase